MINDDNTVNLDLEGIVAVMEGFWVASEGRGTFDDQVESLNLLILVSHVGIIQVSQDTNQGFRSR